MFAGATAASFILTGMIRRYALSHDIVDFPNERSSHAAPTPRGGGMSVVVTFSVCLILLYLDEQISKSVFIALAGSGIWISIIGFVDDHRHVDAKWRLLSHILGAAWLLYWAGVPAPEWLSPGWIAAAIGGIYIVGLVNAYNFMDGIDGIAAIEAITVSLGAVWVYLLALPGEIAWVAPAALVASTLGFLVWNFPRATVFMGDGCSGFLGVSFAGLSICAVAMGPNFFCAWLVLLGVFIVDASVTLFRRFLRRERLYVAHRAHAYQYASRRFGSHAKVSAVVAFINVAWLSPIALAVANGWLVGLLGLALAYVPLIALAFVFKAGAADLQGAYS